MEPVVATTDLYTKKHSMIKQLELVDKFYSVRLKLAAYEKYSDKLKDICDEQLEAFLAYYTIYKDACKDFEDRCEKLRDK